MLRFKKFEPKEKGLIKKWFKSDNLGMRFIPSYVTNDFTHLVDFQKRYLWIVSEGTFQIGFLILKLKQRRKGMFHFIFLRNIEEVVEV
jgi:hypothetical protein